MGLFGGVGSTSCFLGIDSGGAGLFLGWGLSVSGGAWVAVGELQEIRLARAEGIRRRRSVMNLRRGSLSIDMGGL